MNLAMGDFRALASRHGIEGDDVLSPSISTPLFDITMLKDYVTSLLSSHKFSSILSQILL